jgi:hypothetical protein
MKACLKLVAAALLTAPLSVLNLNAVAAQTADAAASADAFCDYCKDYTDAGTSAGTVRSAYRPGVGYSAQTAATTQPQQEQAKLQPLQKPSRLVE